MLSTAKKITLLSNPLSLPLIAYVSYIRLYFITVLHKIYYLLLILSNIPFTLTLDAYCLINTD